MQQDQYEADFKDRGVLSELWYVLCENWQVILVVVTVVGVVMDVIILGMYFSSARDARSDMLAGLAILFTSISLGGICIYGMVVFVRLLRSSRDQSFSENTCDVPSGSCDKTECSTRKCKISVNSRTADARRPKFASRSGSDYPPERFSNLKSEPKARRESAKKYLRNISDDVERKVCSSSEATEYSQDTSGISKHELNRNGQSNFPVNDNNLEITGCQQRNRLERNEYWSRRSRCRRKYLHENRTEPRLQQYTNVKSPKSRLRSRSETREYKSRTNEMEKENMFLSTRKLRSHRSKKVEYSMEDKTQIHDLERKDKRRMEQSRKELAPREYLCRDKKANEGEHAILHEPRCSIESREQIIMSGKEIDMYVPKNNKENVKYPFFSTEILHSLTRSVDNDFSHIYGQPSIHLPPSSIERDKYLQQCRGDMDYPSAGNREAEHYAPRSYRRILEQLPRNTEGQNCFPMPETEIKNLPFSSRGRVMYPKCATEDEEYLPHSSSDMVQNSTVMSENVRYIRQFPNYTIQHPSIFREESIDYLPRNSNNKITSYEYKPSMQLERCSSKNREPSEHLWPRLSETRVSQPNRAGANDQTRLENIERFHHLQNRNVEYVFRNAKEYEEYLRYLELKDKQSRYIQGIESQLRTHDMIVHPPSNHPPRDSIATVII